MEQSKCTVTFLKTRVYYTVLTQEENECLRALHRAESYEALRNKRAVNWFNIAEKFNKKRRGAGKELKREQIYQHFYHLMDSITTCTPAEVQVVLALEEIGLSDEPIANFLDNGVREATKIMSIIKESKQKTKPLTDTDEEQRRQRFRRKITSYIGAVLAKVPLESSDNAALDQEPIEMSDTRRKWDASDTATKEEILRQLKKWVESDPKIKRKMHTIAPIGRPHKTMTLSKSISELARLLRPFRKAYRWRQRITYHPGDIRKSALSSFTLHRLLGAPFEVSKLPDARDEDADETRRVAAVTKSLIKKRPLEYPADGDKMSYFAMDVPPGESLLPPTLHTVAGIRGLLLHKTNLEETAREECEDDVDDEAASRSRVRRSERYGDAESDDKLMRCMLSLFYWPMRLCLKIVNNELVQLDNSDGDSDSDDEKCWPTGSVHWPGF